MTISDQKRILIVEDESSLRLILTLELTNAGYEVLEAENGHEGFKLALEYIPDLIISDVVMPKMDGSQLLKQLRSNPDLKQIPCIIMTGRNKMRDYFETIEVDQFLEKPFHTAELLATVQRIFRTPRQAQTQPSSSMPGDKWRIMILENDEMVLPALASKLTNKGYSVKRVHTVIECLDEAVRLSPHLIISNYVFDGLSGSRLVDLLRNISHLKLTPIILYASSSLESDKVTKLASDASVFLSDISDDEISRKTDILISLQKK